MTHATGKPHDADRPGTNPDNSTEAQRHHDARTRLIRAAPRPEVVAAAHFLLHQPDAHLYRRRYLELLTRTTGPDGTSITEYAAAEKYLLTAAAKLHRQAPAEP